MFNILLAKNTSLQPMKTIHHEQNKHSLHQITQRHYDTVRKEHPELGHSQWTKLAEQLTSAHLAQTLGRRRRSCR